MVKKRRKARPYRVLWEINPRERIREKKRATDVRCVKGRVASPDHITEEEINEYEDYYEV